MTQMVSDRGLVSMGRLYKVIYGTSYLKVKMANKPKMAVNWPFDF